MFYVNNFNFILFFLNENDGVLSYWHYLKLNSKSPLGNICRIEIYLIVKKCSSINLISFNLWVGFMNNFYVEIIFLFATNVFNLKATALSFILLLFVKNIIWRYLETLPTPQYSAQLKLLREIILKLNRTLHCKVAYVLSRRVFLFLYSLHYNVKWKINDKNYNEEISFYFYVM